MVVHEHRMVIGWCCTTIRWSSDGAPGRLGGDGMGMGWCFATIGWASDGAPGPLDGHWMVLEEHRMDFGWCSRTIGWSSDGAPGELRMCVAVVAALRPLRPCVADVETVATVR